MRKQVQQMIDILNQIEKIYLSEHNDLSPDKIVNKVIPIIMNNWNIGSTSVYDVMSRKYRPHIKDMEHFKDLVEDWLQGSSEALELALRKKSNNNDKECQLINTLFKTSHQKHKISDELFPESGFTDKESFREGGRLIKLHLAIERNQTLVKKAKKQWLNQGNGEIRCLVCGFSFEETYGELGAGYIEAHHLIPLSQLEESYSEEKDLVPVCSNCHRMLHRKPDVDINDLKTIIQPFRRS